MPLPRRLWCTNAVLGYLAGDVRYKTEYDLIIAAAQRGEIEIAVSTLAEAEVAYLQGQSDIDSEQRISEFFGRSYVIPIAFDRPVAVAARRLIREGKRLGRKLKPPDAIHLGTCELWNIPILETDDQDLLAWDGSVGTPRINIRKPQWEGTRPFPNIVSVRPPEP